jgi:hypothetical protein
MKEKRLRRHALAVILASLALASADAEILVLRDGSVVAGTIMGSAGSGEVVYSIGGQERRLAADDIVRSGPDALAFADLDVEARLKDGSVIKGTIENYDDEELSLETSVGALPIAMDKIARVVAPRFSAYRSGPSFAAKAGGGGYVPLTDGASRFGPSYCGAFGAAWSLPFLRGLYAGFETELSSADYLAGGASYSFFSLKAEVTYRFLGIGGTGRLVPFVAFAAGPAYVGVESSASTPSSYGDLVAATGVSAGLEYSVARALSVRLESRAEAYAQDGSPFMTASGILSVVYER